jgi:hypothetical protein
MFQMFQAYKLAYFSVVVSYNHKTLIKTLITFANGVNQCYKTFLSVAGNMAKIS